MGIMGEEIEEGVVVAGVPGVRLADKSDRGIVILFGVGICCTLFTFDSNHVLLAWVFAFM